MSFTPGRSDGEYFTWDRFYLYHEQDLEKISQRSRKKNMTIKVPETYYNLYKSFIKKGRKPNLFK